MSIDRILELHTEQDAENFGVLREELRAVRAELATLRADIAELKLAMTRNAGFIGGVVCIVSGIVGVIAFVISYLK